MLFIWFVSTLRIDCQKKPHASPILIVRISQWHAHLLSPYRYYEVGASIPKQIETTFKSIHTNFLSGYFAKRMEYILFQGIWTPARTFGKID